MKNDKVSWLDNLNVWTGRQNSISLIRQMWRNTAHCNRLKNKTLISIWVHISWFLRLRNARKPTLSLKTGNWPFPCFSETGNWPNPVILKNGDGIFPLRGGEAASRGNTNSLWVMKGTIIFPHERLSRSSEEKFPHERRSREWGNFFSLRLLSHKWGKIVTRTGIEMYLEWRMGNLSRPHFLKWQD